jgi:hypothetical protein
MVVVDEVRMVMRVRMVVVVVVVLVGDRRLVEVHVQRGRVVVVVGDDARARADRPGREPGGDDERGEALERWAHGGAQVPARPYTGGGHGAKGKDPANPYGCRQAPDLRDIRRRRLLRKAG